MEVEDGAVATRTVFPAGARLASIASFVLFFSEFSGFRRWLPVLCPFSSVFLIYGPMVVSHFQPFSAISILEISMSIPIKAR